MIFLLDVALFAVAWILSALLSRAGNKDRARRTAAAATEIRDAGLMPEGDVLGSFSVRGSLHGLDVALTNRTTAKRPGASEEGSSAACVARVTSGLPDQIVCKASEVDQVMGPLPAAPRVRTGHAPFDAGYAIFVSPVGEVAGGSYRSPGGGGAVPWAKPALLDRLQELDMLWLRVQDGRVEIVFPPLEVEDLGRAAAVAAGVASTQEGRALPSFLRGPRLVRPPARDRDAGVFTAWGVAALAGLCTGIPLAFAPPLLALDEGLYCGPRDHLIETSCGEGGCVECKKHPDNTVFPHYLACILLAMAVLAIGGLAIVALRGKRSA